MKTIIAIAASAPTTPPTIAPIATVAILRQTKYLRKYKDI